VLALGEYPIVSLVVARRLRDEARATLAAGVSPVMAARARKAMKAEHATNTFASKIDSTIDRESG